MEPFMIFVAGTALLIASLTDIWFREVPDWVSYALIAAAAGGRLLFALQVQSYTPLLNGLIGFLFATVIGLTLYRMGQWGGGDAKLLIGLAGALGISVGIPDKDFLSFFAYLLPSACVYGIIWFLALAIIHKKTVLKRIRTIQDTKSFKTIRIILWILILGVFGGYFFLHLHPIISTALVFCFTMLLLGIHLTALTKAVEKEVFIKKISPLLLTEGDWICEPVTVAGKVVSKPSDMGVSAEVLKYLQELYKQGRIKFVVVKEGIPFVPAFFIAFVLFLILPSVWQLLSIL